MKYATRVFTSFFNCLHGLAEVLFKRFSALFCLVLPATLPALSVYDYQSDLHDRFANSPEFVASDWDLSGVGRANTGQWVTMISPTIFISSNHYHPAIGTSVTFYGSNDPNGFSVTRQIAGSQQLGTSDIRIGILDSAVPTGIRHYSVAGDPILSATADPETGFLTSQYYLAEALFIGRSPSAYPASKNMSVGFNVIDRFTSRMLAGGASGSSLEARIDDYGIGNFVEHEATLQTFDSGAPVMVMDDYGDITIVGTNWAVRRNAQGETTWNVFSYIGNHSTEIFTIYPVEAVPEPKFAALFLGIGAAGMLARRRKTRFGHRRPKTAK